MIGRRDFVIGIIAAPALVRASSLDFVPRDLSRVHAKKWWWNPRPMCGQCIGFFYGRKPQGFGWRRLDGDFYKMQREPVMSVDPAKYNRLTKDDT